MGFCETAAARRLWKRELREYFGRGCAKLAGTYFRDVMRETVAGMDPQQLRDCCLRILANEDLKESEREELNRVLYNLPQEGETDERREQACVRSVYFL